MSAKRKSEPAPHTCGNCCWGDFWKDQVRGECVFPILSIELPECYYSQKIGIERHHGTNCGRWSGASKVAKCK